jgi:hypothetical protein
MSFFFFFFFFFLEEGTSASSKDVGRENDECVGCDTREDADPEPRRDRARLADPVQRKNAAKESRKHTEKRVAGAAAGSAVGAAPGGGGGGERKKKNQIKQLKSKLQTKKL